MERIRETQKLIFSLGTQVDENVEMAVRAFDQEDTRLVNALFRVMRI